MKKHIQKFLSAVLVFSFFLSANPARAEDTLSVTGKRVRIVTKSAIYGLGGGLVVGVASQVFEKKVKNIFMFGSLGLYAGIILGLYVVSTSSGPAPYEGPDTYDDYGTSIQPLPGTLALQSRNRDLTAKNDIQFNLLDVKF